MSRENSTSRMAIWTDLTRRGPNEVRAAPATEMAYPSRSLKARLSVTTPALVVRS
jgi:hypothetical protein